MPSILESGNKAAIDSVKKDKPSSFSVGAHADILAKKGDVVASYDYKWTNGWGITAYAKAWWNDQAVVPVERKGVEAGVDATFKF